MAAIRKPPPITAAPKKTIIGTKSGQPPSFRATGQGYFNKLPRFPADAKIANGILTNNATPSSNALYKLYLFVDAVETGWSLSGQTSQAQTSRSFYPLNMSQNDLTIQGVTASQYEYDRIVEFVQHHHLSQFNPGSTSTPSLDGDSFHYQAVTFLLVRPQIGGTNFMPPMKYDVVVTNIDAGHERFLNFPTYTLTCKVTYDYLNQGEDDKSRELDYLTTIKDVYGDIAPPVLSTGSDSPSTSQSSQPPNKNVPQPTHPGTNP